MNVDVPAALDGARTDRALAELPIGVFPMHERNVESRAPNFSVEPRDRRKAQSGSRSASHFAATEAGYNVGTMTRISQFNAGKMETHGQPVGLASPGDLDRRAREIAEIAGRAAPTPEDRDQARRELLNIDLPPTLAQDAGSSMQSLSRDPSDPAVDRGHQTPEYIESDEEEAVERLALEGVEEAQHDQMVQAHNSDEDELDGR